MMALMMSTKAWWMIILILFVGIVVMTGFLIALPTSEPSPAIMAPATSTSQEEGVTTSETIDEEFDSSQPLSAHVLVTSPQPKQRVEHSFTVAGVAPGEWYFEGQFPMQVRDMEGNVIGRATAAAHGDWTTEKLVTFTAKMQIDATHSGPAKLILLKSNPSGMPENDDALEIEIVID